jgi:hypothetical protein
MTSLLSPPSTPTTDRPRARSLWLAAGAGGAAAALGPLAVCCLLAVAGWFAADAGLHGEPRDALRVGALGWLTAHGSGVRVDGVLVTALPLLLTLGCAWAVWRAGLRVGEAVSGHGPDADRLADGERDWTVPGATAVLAVAYAAVLLVTAALAGTPATAVSSGRAGLFAVLLCLTLGGTAVAVGSGRAAVWAALAPASLRAAAAAAWSVLRLFAAACALTLLVALLLDLASAANVLSQLDTDVTDTVMVVLVSALLVPNAVAFAGAYLLGPGFAVGAGTLVSPTAVVLGPLPLLPLLAALPGDGRPPVWVPALLAVPAVVAAVAVWRALRERPCARWDAAALRGCGAGLLAAVGVAVAAALAGGAVGPGRMRVVGPVALDVFVHALPAFCLGGLVGALVATWGHRRGDDA